MIEISDRQTLMLISGGIDREKMFRAFTSIVDTAFCFVMGDVLNRWLNGVGLMHPVHAMTVTVLQFAILPIINGYFVERTKKLVEKKNG